MRILMLGKGWFPSQLGGLDRYYRELLEELPEARGVVVGPAAGAGPRVIAASTHQSLLPLRLLSFWRAARKEGPHADVVDAHFALYALLPLILSELRKKPLLVHFQGPWADESVSAGDRSRWRHLTRGLLERKVYSRADTVVTLTGAFRRLLIERYGVSPWRTTVLRPGVDVDRFSPGDQATARERLGLEADSFVVCCVRRLVPRMGIDVLIEAWTAALARDPKARLLIAGDGEQRGQLERQIASMALDQSVTLLGRVPDDALVQLYQAADVNVVPTLEFEGFGLVVLEAAACGTPSVVTNAGGLPEAVQGLGDDVIVPAGDVDALGARLGEAALGQVPSRESVRAWAEHRRWAQIAEAHRMLFARASRPRGERPRRLRVVYLDHVARLSGGELALLRLLKAQTQVDAHVILAEDGPLVERLHEIGASVEVLPMGQRISQFRKDSVRVGGVTLVALADTIAYTLRLARRLRKLRPDIVHTNSLKSGIYGSLAGYLARIPVVWHLRDRIETDYLPPLGMRLVRALIRQLPEVVITNSQATMSTVRPKGSSMVVWSAVSDMASLDQDGHMQASDTGDPPLVVGITGRLAPWKGQDVFLRAFAEAFPDGAQRAVIVGAPLFGASETAYAESLRALADDLGIANRVEFRGHRDDVRSELRAMDVLVHASTTPEPFGQVIVEGMAARLAVVAAREGGPGEIVTDGIDGLLYSGGDVSALADILIKLQGDRGLRLRLSEAAANRARDFAPEAVAAQISAAYHLATSSRRKINRGFTARRPRSPR
jgi:glycosyltransferase involved in cell wall biosynthesis